MVIVQNNHTRTTKLLCDIQSNEVIQKYMEKICMDMQGLMQAFALEVSMRGMSEPSDSAEATKTVSDVLSVPKATTIADHIHTTVLTQMACTPDDADAHTHHLAIDSTASDGPDQYYKTVPTKSHIHSDAFARSKHVFATAQAYAVSRDGPSGMPHASIYTTVYHELMCTATRGNIRDTGWVFPGHVLSVLADGNARERCFVLSNLLFKDPHATLVCWLLSTERFLTPSSINEAVVCEYRDRIHSIVCKRNTHGARDALHHVRKMLCGKHTQRNKKIRFPRARDERSHYQVRATAIIPELSCREQAMLEVYMRENSGFLPWRTGLMYWQLKENSTFILHANNKRQSVISGLSGHTDAMLTFTGIFKNFNLTCMTLVCVLWLCGCEHHSVYEVVTTAHEHGLPYTQEDAIDFAAGLLRSL